jgi:lysozyme
MAGVRTSGIDVSRHNGLVNWTKVKQSGQYFAFAKASEGLTWKDPKFADNLQRARDAALPIGAYHFYRPSLSGQEQARNFLDAYAPQAGDLLPVCDLEDFDGGDPREFVNEVRGWVDTVSGAIGGDKPIIYTSASFWRKIGNPDDFRDHPLWVAHYGVSAPALPRPWTAWTVWQHSDSGVVSGVTGNCDVNWFAGAADELSRILI